jgi:hypothetical protein
MCQIPQSTYGETQATSLAALPEPASSQQVNGYVTPPHSLSFLRALPSPQHYQGGKCSPDEAYHRSEQGSRFRAHLQNISSTTFPCDLLSSAVGPGGRAGLRPLFYRYGVMPSQLEGLYGERRGGAAV